MTLIYIFLLVFTMMTTAPVMGQQNKGYEVGDIVKDFALKGVSGETVSLQDFNEANGYIIIFSCNHCPYVKAYESRMIALDEKYKSQGYPVIAINPNNAEAYPADSYQNMKKRAKEKGYTFPYLRDKTQEVARRFGAKRTPHVFLLKKTENGPKVFYEGAIDDNVENPNNVDHNYVEDAIEAIKNNEKPDLAKTKAIGCTIKWKN